MTVFARVRNRTWIAALVLLVVLLLIWLGLRLQDAPMPKQVVQEQVEAPIATAGVADSSLTSPDWTPPPVSPALKQCTYDLQALTWQRSDELSKSSNARSQLAYALVVRYTPGPELSESLEPEQRARAFAEQAEKSQRALARSRALAPDDPDILWLAANQCGVDDACDTVQQELMRAEPDNAAVWLMAMSWAQHRNDANAERVAFERAIKSVDYDRHGGSAFMAVLDGYQGMEMPATCSGTDVQKELREAMGWGKPVTALDWVLVKAVGFEQLSFPTYSGLMRKCRAIDDPPLAPSLHQGCIQLISRIADGDTLREQVIGARVLVELTAGTPEGPIWRERYRNQQWMMEQVITLHAQATLTPEQVATGEVRAMQRALEQQGRWPPPADWLPDDERARSLIQTGRPPPPKAR